MFKNNSIKYLSYFGIERRLVDGIRFIYYTKKNKIITHNKTHEKSCVFLFGAPSMGAI